MPELRSAIYLSAAFAAGVICSTASSASAEGGLSPLAGSWSGGGTITMSSGSSERLRCRANYAVGGSGSSVTQDLKCASDSYRVDIRSNVAVSGGALSGTWTETSRGVGGQISGRLNGSDIQATVAGGVFGAGLSIATHGSSQSINIRVNGGDVSKVSLNLKKN